MKITWQERLWSKAQPDQNGCWIWQAHVDPDGYGLFRGPARDGRSGMSSAHRWAFIAAHGSVPADLVVDHLCNVTLCINPQHLEAVTNAENQRRRAERRTHCKRGHELTPENTRRSATCRRCRLCERERSRRSRELVST